ncbi:hypothetical protein GCM10010264_69010 [Streptomyces globisporus]|nr:hypothetical protein GCM10010264_69010 [Streptomyces globisporus]
MPGSEDSEVSLAGWDSAESRTAVDQKPLDDTAPWTTPDNMIAHGLGVLGSRTRAFRSRVDPAQEQRGSGVQRHLVLGVHVAQAPAGAGRPATVGVALTGFGGPSRGKADRQVRLSFLG